LLQRKQGVHLDKLLCGALEMKTGRIRSKHYKGEGLPSKTIAKNID
jgi:hypothetical protein